MNSDLITHLPPAFILIFGGFILPFFQENAKRILILSLPLLALYQSWNLPAELADHHFSLMGFDVKLLFAHEYSLIFATIFCVMAFTGGLYGLGSASLTESSAAFIYAGGALGIVFSGDLFSFFIYWELMAVASTIIVMCGGSAAARFAGLRYAYIHFIGGVILLSGILAYVTIHGSAEFSSLGSHMDWLLTTSPDSYTIAIWLMLIGILVNAAVFPASAWLPDSYPEASPTGAVFLSAYTTKTTVFTLMVLFAGNGLLIYAGILSIIYGLTYAIVQNDIRRALAYGLISQVGVMLVGIGVGTDAALLAVALVAFGHILYKGLWFMVAGAVIKSTERQGLHELGALWHHHKPLAAIAGIASLAMIAPLTAGFIGKSMLSESLTASDVGVAYYLVTASAACMFLVLFRLFWQIFFEKAPQARATIRPIPLPMYLAMIVMAAIATLPSFPYVYGWLLTFSPAVEQQAVSLSLYSAKHLLAQTEIILFTILAFFVLKPFLKTNSSLLLDIDWCYRVLLKRVLSLALKRIHSHYWHTIQAHIEMGVRHITRGTYKLHGPKGIFSRNWNISITVMWSILLLGVYLVLYYTS